MSNAMSLNQAARSELAREREKKAIQSAFGRAASTYDNSAAFQRRVGNELLSMHNQWQGMRVLDVGCGTGYFSQIMAEKGAEVIALDLSPQMLAKAQQRCGDGLSYLSGDAEELPLATNSVDIAFSSLALQWCSDLSVPLKELKRVVKPGGKILFTTLLEGSLHELKAAWQAVDGTSRVNAFIPLKQVNLALAQTRSASRHVECKSIMERYPSALALMKDLKGIGATHLQEGRNAGLVGRGTIQALEKAYRQFQLNDGSVPATYQVCFGAIENE